MRENYCAVEIPANAEWRKATYSEAHGSCVELTPVGAGFAVRDSKNTDGPVMRPVVSGWAVFLGRVRTDGFDRRA
ncbi:MAG TPA: DUF397 domain-containing protein [Actinophytocola sp.]|nr:DUF397 domain-containing protein [Actinophytocola sp.]